MIVTLIQEINNNNLSEDYLPMIITQERLEDLEKLTEDIRHQIATHPTRSPSSIGRGQDRRHAAKPPPGPERRTGSERRD